MVLAIDSQQSGEGSQNKYRFPFGRHAGLLDPLDNHRDLLAEPHAYGA